MKRARKGSGSFRRLKVGWEYRFSLGPGERRSVSAPTQALCRERAEEERLRWRYRLPSDAREPLTRYMARWLEAQAVRLRPRTVIQYRTSTTSIILPTIGTRAVGDLSHRDVEAMMRAAVKRGLAPRTANLARAVLSAAMKDAMRDGLIATNPAMLARPIPSRRPRVHPPTPEQVETLLHATRESRRWPLYVVAVNLGLRQGELLALRWQDVEGGLVRVQQTLRLADGVYHFDPPKTYSSTRVLPQTADVAEAFAVQREITERERQEAGARWLKTHDRMGLVFRSHYGAPVNGWYASRTIHEDLRAAGLPRFRFHDLRHACATWLLSRGVEMRVIASILGHASTAITSDTYSHVSEAMMRDALERLAR